MDESLFSIDDARRLVDAEAADVAVIKIAKFGGPRNAWEVARVFDAAGKPALLSSPYESFIAKSAGFALALSLETADRAQELAHFLDEEPYAEWSHSISGRCVHIRRRARTRSRRNPLPRREDSENHGITEKNGPFTCSGE